MLALFAFIALWGISGFSADAIVFGPQTYTRGTGQPTTITKTFNVSHPSGKYRLRVANHGVTSAVVSLNRQTALRPDDFKSDKPDDFKGDKTDDSKGDKTDDSKGNKTAFVPFLERTVALRAGTNEIAVQLRSQPGTSLTLEIVGEIVDNIPPTITAHADPPANVSGWNNTTVTVTFTCSDATSAVAMCPTPIIVAGEGGGQVVSGTAVDKAGNTATTRVTLNIDKTPPLVTATQSPAANSNGWNNGPVIVMFAAIDAVSGVAPGSLTPPVTLSADGANLSVSGLAMDLAGNVGSATRSGVNIDQTNPVITVTVGPAPNAKGWNNTAVTAHFTCTDAGSGIATCPTDQVIATDGPDQTVTGTAIDAAGNSTSATSAAFGIDQTKPSITVALSPAANGNGYYHGPVTAHFTCSDTGSGIDGCPADQVVSAEGANQTVTGTAKDNAGNSASLTSAPFNIDVGPPTITATLSPAPNANGWNNGPVTAHFTCTDAGAGIATCPPDQAVSSDGANQTVTGTATDNADNTTSVTSAAFNIDQAKPAIAVALTPAPNGWLNTPVTAHFTCSDTGSGIDSCPSDQLVSTDGANLTVTGTAFDKAGNTASVVSDGFNIDLGPPTITATLTPAPNANGWNNGPVTAHFICGDAGAGVAVCPSDQVISTDGANQAVSGRATDNAGNSAAAGAIVNIDQTPPVLSLGSPANGVALFTPKVTASGTVSDVLSGMAGVTCNSVAATVSGLNIACDLTLTPGANALTATATDLAGNTSTSTVSFTYTRVPQVTITSPAVLSYLNVSPTTVTGIVDDPTATVTINSVAAPVAGGSFSIPLPLAEGPNLITATATAASGAIGTASVEMTLDTTPPHVTITSPADGFTTSEASISISGNVNDIVVGTVNDQQAQVTVNGVGAQVANRTFLATTVPLAIGLNTIQAVARDRVGNAATTQVSVIRQVRTLQPQIRLISGNGQTGVIGSLLSEPLAIELSDGLGNTVPNKTVIFKVTQNDGTLSAGGDPAVTVLTTTDARGRAQAGWTVGHRAGAGGNVVEAYSVGFEGTAIFTASGAQGTAGKIVVDTGNDQIGAIGQSLPKPFIAVVVDGGSNRLGGVPVTFTVRQGGGTFDGQPTFTTTSDSDGRVAATLTLGLQEGSANNLVEASFPFNTGFAAAFTGSGRAPGNPAETTISGVIADNSNVPIPGVTVRAVLTSVVRSNLAAVAAATAVQTDAQGQFTIPQAPVGLIKLMIDGTTAQREGTYPSLEYDLVTVAGQKNDVGQPIYLLALSTANQLCVTATTGGGTLTIPEAPGFSLTFGPGQVTFPGGSRAGCVSVTVVNSDKVPMVPGFGQQPRFIVTIQPSGAAFNPPAPITLPNVDGLKPREVTEMYSFDHDIGSFVAIGTGVVSDDGQVIRSSAGVGVLKAGWHCGGSPNTTGTAATCPTCYTCQGTQCVIDSGQDGHPTPDLPPIMTINQDGTVTVTGPSPSGQCCVNGNAVNNQPISNLSQCPNRVAGPWTYQYDGCSLPSVIPGSIRNNPAQGNSTLFSDDHLGPLATHNYACDYHDRCYQTCAGADMVGGQETCDLLLRDTALATCNESLSNEADLLSDAAALCFVFAEQYYKGLSSTGFNLGKTAYETRQKQVCQCCQ